RIRPNGSHHRTSTQANTASTATTTPNATSSPKTTSPKTTKDHERRGARDVAGGHPKLVTQIPCHAQDQHSRRCGLSSGVCVERAIPRAHPHAIEGTVAHHGPAQLAGLHHRVGDSLVIVEQ